MAEKIKATTQILYERLRVFADNLIEGGELNGTAQKTLLAALISTFSVR